jgi:SOS-response transcriptional repressor LexA
MTDADDDDDREPLTGRQAQWLQAVREYYARTGTAPSLQRIADLMGVGSVNTVAVMFRRLARKGYLIAVEHPPDSGRFRYVPVDRVVRATAPVISERTARFVAEIRREAAELRKRVVQLERIATEMEGEGRRE